MEVERLRGHARAGLDSDIEVEGRHRDRAAVLGGDPGRFVERHRPDAVESAARGADRKRDVVVPLAESEAEEVGERSLDGRLRLAVPVAAEDDVAEEKLGPLVLDHRHPPASYDSRALVIDEGDGPAVRDFPPVGLAGLPRVTRVLDEL